MQTMAGDRVIQSDAEVGSVAFSPDGAVVAGICRDDKLRLWDVRSGALKRTVAWDKGDAGVSLLSPADMLAAVGADGSVKVWDLQTGALTRRPGSPSRKVRSLTFSADRKLFAAGSHTSDTGSEDTVRLWDAAGKERFAVASGIGGTSAMAISPDGATLVAASYDTNVRAWSARNGELLRLIEELPVAIFAMSFSPDGKYLAAAGVDRTVYLWDAKTWKLSRKLAGQEEMIQSLGFSADSRRLLTGGFNALTNKHPVSILLWDVASGEVLRKFPAPQAVRSVAFSGDGKLAAASYSQKAVSIWTLP